MITLTLSEGRVYGARYYTVYPIIETAWNTEPRVWNEMMRWMIATFGPSADNGVWTPGMCWYANNARFWFRNKEDRDWFLLKWS